MDASEILPGTMLGSYRVIRTLGEGGMGAVYEVEHTQLGMHYALKTYTLTDEHAELFRKRFAAEGKMLARFNHPNLVRVIDLDVDLKTGMLYYVMDLVLYKDGEARTLSDLEPGGADEDHLVDWFCQLADALTYVHSQGIVHRDIKLNNILLAPGRRVILSDFGISRIVSEELRTDLGTDRTIVSGVTGGLIVGTQGYMAPEVREGKPATPAADVYALGVVFFKLLTGIWYDDDLEPGDSRRQTCATDAARLLEHFAHPWKEILPRMLARDPLQRPTDLMALSNRLAGALKAPAKKNARGSFRKRLTFALVSAALVAALSLTAWRFLTPDSARSDDDLADEAFSIPDSVQ